MIAVYSGTFDPVTNGHIDIIERASKMYDSLYVVIFNNPEKSCLFDINERKALLKESLKHLDNIIIDVNDGLVVDYAKKVNAQVIVRGLRNIKDFEYEKDMAVINAYLNDSIETVFLMSDAAKSFISSSYIKELASYHCDIQKLAPGCVCQALIKKMEKK